MGPLRRRWDLQLRRNNSKGLETGKMDGMGWKRYRCYCHCHCAFAYTISGR